MTTMANYAQDSDLDDYDPSVRDQDGDDFTKFFTRATADVLNLIKGSWWTQATGLPVSSFDESNLNTEALRQLTVYKALYAHIYPFFATYLEGDTWLEKINAKKKLFDEEWAVIKGLPLYDLDGDDVFEDEERPGPSATRLSRG